MQKIVIAAPAKVLRNPNHEAHLARYWKALNLSATATADQIAWEPYPWHISGNVVFAHEQEELDIERMDASEDPFTYTMDGVWVFVEKRLDAFGCLDRSKCAPLLNTNWAFHKDKRRTMNRFLAKADSPSCNQVRSSLLSMMFWADVSMRIREDA